MSRIRALVAAAMLVVGTGAPASAQIVADGGFEQFLVSGYNYNPVGGLWSFVGGSGLINGFGTAFNSPTPVAGQGNQFAFLQANQRRAWGVVTTKITLPTSGNYFLSFLNAGRGQPVGATAGGDAIFDVLLNTALLGQFTSITNEGWSLKGTQFFANAGTYDLIFTTDTKLAGDNTTFFDNVEINAVHNNLANDAVTAAPEPASLALMLTGLVGVAGVAVRRKRRA